MNYIEIISRPKLNLLGWHFGVRLSNGTCYDFQPAGIRKIPETEFASGFEIQKGTRINETKLAHKRLMDIVNNKIKYDFLNFNCENFARYLVEGKSESKQVTFLAITSLAIGFLWLSSENSS